jgi:hypothetical protein
MERVQLGNLYSIQRKIFSKVPIIQPWTYDCNLFKFMKESGLSYNSVGMICWAMLSAFAFVLGNSLAGKSDEQTGFSGEIQTKRIALKINIREDNTWQFDLYNADAVSIMTEQEWIFLKSYSPSAITHLLELSAANQVGRLNERNVVSYFAMQGAELSVNQIMKVINFTSSVLPKLIEINDFQESSKEVKWIEYHTSAASTPQLVRKCIDDTERLIKWSKDTLESVNNSIARPWDMRLVLRIKSKAIQITYCYLEASNTLPPGKWYQGEKEITKMPSSVRYSYGAAFKKYLELRTDVKAIVAAESIEGLAQFFREEV